MCVRALSTLTGLNSPDQPPPSASPVPLPRAQLSPGLRSPHSGAAAPSWPRVCLVPTNIFVPLGCWGAVGWAPAPLVMPLCPVPAPCPSLPPDSEEEILCTPHPNSQVLLTRIRSTCWHFTAADLNVSDWRGTLETSPN